MNELTKIYDQKLHFDSKLPQEHVVTTEYLYYTPVELFLKKLGKVVVDRAFLVVLSITSFLTGVLIGLWVF